MQQPGHTVVLAGPGSGKTDTLAVRVGYALEREVDAPRRIACLTYSNDAVREFTARLGSLGIHGGDRIFAGTVHGFCLTQVIRPFALLFDRPDLASRKVLSAPVRLALIQRSLDAAEINDRPQWADSTFTVIRRAIACDEDLSRLDDRYVAAVRVFNELLVSENAIDFEGMVLEALSLVRENEGVRDLLVARYPSIVVDEYQDMGGPLHQLVLTLRDAGATIFAVGDPDQCIFAFTGADPRYLAELPDQLRTVPIQLRFNYRAGASLIATAERMLESPRGYQVAPGRTDPGEILFEDVPGGLTGQAAKIVDEILPTLLKSGVPGHEIAVLYRARGALLEAIEERLRASDLPYVLERDARFSDAPIVKWLQRCAANALDPYSTEAESFSDLYATYRQILEDCGRLAADPLEDECRFAAIIDSASGPDTPLFTWISDFDDGLKLSDLLALQALYPDDENAVHDLEDALQFDGISIAEFAQGGRVHGKVAVTTYHGSKGRQFSAVILPGLQRTLVPSMRWNPRRREYEITDRQLADERRLFYVGLTRAKQTVIVMSSPSFKNAGGYAVEGRSQFIDELAERLSEEDGSGKR